MFVNVSTVLADAVAADIPSKKGLSALWHTSFITVSGNDIRFSNIVIACLILFLGIYFSKKLSGIIEAFIIEKFKVRRARISSVSTISHYVLIAIIAIFALRISNIPLTIFTFLGGAIAVGVGFGSQNIINNFISGLIILFERPIKMGDLVEIDGELGKVDHIGARSSRLLKPNNTHVIVPNSWWLEKKVHNWNYENKKIRSSITVGVAYGSDVNLAMKALESACIENKKISTYPKPTVLFKNFADSSLTLEVLFWLDVNAQLERLEIESQLRLQINQEFMSKGIEISFPQRDVYLASKQAIDINIVK